MASKNLQHLVGKVIEYDPQPFGARRVLVEKVVEDGQREAYMGGGYCTVRTYRIEGRVISGLQRSRIGAHVSDRDLTGDYQLIERVSPDWELTLHNRITRIAA